MQLVLPAAGASSRFPNTRAKWALTHPNGNLMICEAIRGLCGYDDIFIGLNQKDYERYGVGGIKKEFYIAGLKEPHVCNVGMTKNQPETILRMIDHFDLDNEPVFIKDSDNTFNLALLDKNQVAVAKLTDFPKINAGNKSYTIGLESLETIVEKKIISDTFCVGGYGFVSGSLFRAGMSGLIHADLYVSDVVRALHKQGKDFAISHVQGYFDWGTEKDWIDFCRTFKTVFIDLDGVLLKNGHRSFRPSWEDAEPIGANRDVLRGWMESGRVEIIITTARPESVREQTEKQLQDFGIPYHRILFGLRHARRILVNDFAPTNPYPSAQAVNLPRNAEMLRDYDD